MKLQRFNPDGVAAFATYRARLTLEPTLPPPVEMLEDPALTELIPGDVDVPKRSFNNRLEAGRFLNELFGTAKVDLPERDQGLWTWLTLFYFDEVCPKDGNGRRNPKDEARLIAQVDNFQRFYRHLLLGPYLIVRAHHDQPERAIAFLCKPLWEPGEIVEQLASRKELVTNHAVAEVATRLYYDPPTGSFKRGAGSSVKGAPRRLAALLNQLDLTYYLYGMTADELLALLPKEFDRFRRQTA
ncbi:MAG TPA: hypothetical protein VN784_04125 [Candidatus Limnocylindrales bacterium]|nr:hypothetical protein [Candidatus Limnocylindrales bacterium]